MRATVCLFSSVSANPGTTAAARSVNNRTDSYWASPVDPFGPRRAGVVSEGTRIVTSPPIPSDSRLVAKIFTPAQRRKIAPHKRATESTKCSQLSSTNSRLRSAQ
ncbi:hypothetical protein GCM10020255_104420 [Rhodococcus baikonurensis]